MTTGGGGIFVGGFNEDPAGITAGAGNVVISNNTIQGNSASGGDGGGIDLEYVNGQDVQNSSNPSQLVPHRHLRQHDREQRGGPGRRRHLAAGRGERRDLQQHDRQQRQPGHRGCGVHAEPDAAAPATRGSRRISRPVWRPTATARRCRLRCRAASRNYSNPRIVNSIIWHNRSFHFGPTAGTCNDNGTGTTGVCDPLDFTNVTAYGLINCATGACLPFTDGGTLEVAGTSGRRGRRRRTAAGCSAR